MAVDHTGRRALITGAGRGIGRAYAERLAADGAEVVIVDLEDPSDAAGELAAAGARAWGLVCDVADPDSVSALAAQVAEIGDIDILVHNAGIYPMRSFDDITYDEWRRVMSVNVDSYFLLTRCFLPGMRARKWGRIVGMSSAMFHLGAQGCPHYVASKGAVVGFVRALAPEVGVDGVTVNAIAPGFIRTPGTSTGVHDAMGMFDFTVSMQAVKRTGVPEDLTGMMSFLVSEEASFITGQTLLVDGGFGRS